MNYYLGGDLGSLEEAVCADAYFEGLGSLGMTSAQRVAAENRQWNYARQHGGPNTLGIGKPQIIGAGHGGKRERHGKGWRDKEQPAAGPQGPAAAKPGDQGGMVKQRQEERQRNEAQKKDPNLRPDLDHRGNKLRPGQTREDAWHKSPDAQGAGQWVDKWKKIGPW